MVKGSELSFNEMDTSVNLNILPLGSYDILIGLDWMESHKNIINCLHKIYNCIDEKGNYHTIKGIYKPMSYDKSQLYNSKILLEKDVSFMQPK